MSCHCHQGTLVTCVERDKTSRGNDMSEEVAESAIGNTCAYLYSLASSWGQSEAAHWPRRGRRTRGRVVLAAPGAMRTVEG